MLLYLFFPDTRHIYQGQDGLVKLSCNLFGIRAVVDSTSGNI